MKDRNGDVSHFRKSYNRVLSRLYLRHTVGSLLSEASLVDLVRG